MAERYPRDGAAANGFGRRHLQEPEAHLLYEAEYPAPPDMRVPASWRLSAGGVPVPPRNEPRYAPDSETLWTLYFERCREEQIASVNGVIPRGRLNSEGWREWWGVPGRTLDAVLDHIETGNVPRLEHLTRPSFSRRRGSSWIPRPMEPGSSSSSGSGSPALRLVMPEPEGTPLGRRVRSGALIINEPLPAIAPTRHSLRLVRPKPEPNVLPVKPEHSTMVAPEDESALKWAKEDYVREQVRRQRRACLETQARSHAEARRRAEEGGVIVIDSGDEDEAGPSSAVGDPGEGCSRDPGEACSRVHDDDDDVDGDYTRFYRLLGM
ncbi:uncharacterized protein [Triticum aestivum]|uniref:uncharacterized protein n=1 Tax=Triticum aestivum TaxID=4565 RepID=UPI001D022320|nr:uncharacterized protein LOC123078074 [Triticum aestivum]